MLTIYELSRYQLGRLYALDPNLDKNWQTTLKQVFDILDDEGRKSIINKILTPRQITFNSLNENFTHQPPPSFKEFCSTLPLDNLKLARVIKDLNPILENYEPRQNLSDVADLLERIFYNLGEIEIDITPMPLC